MNQKQLDDNLLEMFAENAIVQLESLRAKSPNNASILHKLIDFYRRLGQLDKILPLCKQLLQIDSQDAKANYLFDILRTAPRTVAAQDPIWPAPFVQIPDFLEAEDASKLFATILEHKHKFQTAMIFGRKSDADDYAWKVDLSVRNQETINLPSDVKQLFRQHIRQLFPELCHSFGVRPFSPTTVDLHAAVTQQNGFGGVHRDDQDGLYTISFAYYLFQTPKTFKGGDFILYDTDADSDTIHSGHYTKITCQHNSIVLFPSACHHRITPVSMEHPTWEASRFAIAGHIGPNSIAS